MPDCRRLENGGFIPDVSHGPEKPMRGTQDSLRRLNRIARTETINVCGNTSSG